MRILPLVSALLLLLTMAIAGPASAASPGGRFGEGLEMVSPSLDPGASGGVAAWGANEGGQLGDGTETRSDVPAAVSGLTGATAVAGGYHSGVALLENGTVAAWGEAANPPREVPVPVSGLSGVTAIAAGEGDQFALLSNGTVMGWGSNFWGQLGDGTDNESRVPVAVSGLSGVTAIAPHMALLSNGTVMDWGSGGNGELGNGREESSDVPVAVSGLSGVTAIAGGNEVNLALLSNGTVMSWGNNDDGGLGNGTKTNSDVPVAVSGLSGVTAIADYGSHEMALLSNGTVMGWGQNQYGQLGDGSTTGPESCALMACSRKPVAVSGLSGVTAIAAGAYSSLALLSNGTLMAWGNNSSGTLGNGTEVSSDIPVPVSGLKGVTAIAAGSFHDLAVGPPLATVTNVAPRQGPAAGGTAVTITGTNLGGATAIKFGSANAASYKVESEDSITAVSPPGTGQVDVTVTTPGGTGALTTADKFTYGVTVTKVEPPEGPRAGGTHVTITGTAFGGATAVSFGSTPATSFKVESETTISAVSPAGAGVVDITVTTPEATSPTESADRFSYGPTVTGLTPGSGEESGGTSVTITGTNFTGATAVKFGSTNASSFKVESETTIKAVSPAGKHEVDVTVTAYGATSPTAPADKFHYDGPSTCSPHETEYPVVTSVQPSSGPGAGGNSVTIRGNRFVVTAPCEPPSRAIAVFNVRKVMFGTKEAASFREESEGVVTAVAPAGTGTVDITVKTFTTSPTGTADRYTYTPSCTLEGFCTSFTGSEGAELREPNAVAVDPSGNIWAAGAHDVVLEFNAQHEYLRQFGKEGTGEGQFNGIGGIATDASGDVYVTDTGNNRVEEFSAAGTYLRQFGSTGLAAGQFYGPTGIALDSSGDVWVLNSHGVRLQRFSATGEYLSGFGSVGWFSGASSGLAVSGGNLYVSEPLLGRVQEYSIAGTSLALFDERGSGNGKSELPMGIATDPTTGNLYVSDIGSDRVQEFSSAGSFIAAFGSGGSGAGQFSFPRAVAVGSSGRFFAVDTADNRIEEWLTGP